MADHASPATTKLPETQQFDNVSQAGWNGFTKFLLINVVCIVVALVLIASLTVWS